MRYEEYVYWPFTDYTISLRKHPFLLRSTPLGKEKRMLSQAITLSVDSEIRAANSQSD